MRAGALGSVFIVSFCHQARHQVSRTHAKHLWVAYFLFSTKPSHLQNSTPITKYIFLRGNTKIIANKPIVINHYVSLPIRLLPLSTISRPPVLPSYFSSSHSSSYTLRPSFFSIFSRSPSTPRCIFSYYFSILLHFIHLFNLKYRKMDRLLLFACASYFLL